MSHSPSPVLLERLHGNAIIDDAQHSTLAACTPTPWWLALLLGIAAWIAALMIMSSFFGPLMMFDNGPVTRGIGGMVLLAASAFLFHGRKAFTDQMALAFSLAGQGLVLSSVADRFFELLEGSDDVALAALALSAVMAAIPATVLHRSVCVLIALSSLGYLIGAGSGLAVFGVSLAATATALWLGRSAWAAYPRAPLLKAAAHATTLAALCLAPYGNSPSAIGVVGELLLGSQTSLVLPIYRIGSALVLLCTVAWLCRRAGSLRLTALAAAMLFAVAAHPAPGLIVGTTLLLASFHACHRPWIVMSLVFSGLYLGEFYYSLQSTLLVKSLALTASGALLLALRVALRAQTRKTA
ncbi:DUF4401 domain-containing protein [Aromatoleum diolicum]|uniref:DUF4401 domain-containing protein n=1 Tax=Aromatoleum diolicum TaxID=75796 RepID=A0ABX1QCE2_9RHOO|nr:DUF4401 domain-containing protein [Aromatoleum diolicum]NMG75690.1 DUF4401 domain-containing protein [Aromatoleum diolicum]